MTLVEKISAAWKEIDSAVIFKNAVMDDPSEIWKRHEYGFIVRAEFPHTSEMVLLTMVVMTYFMRHPINTYHALKYDKDHLSL